MMIILKMTISQENSVFRPKIHYGNRGMRQIYTNIIVKNLDHGVQGIIKKAALGRGGGRELQNCQFYYNKQKYSK